MCVTPLVTGVAEDDVIAVIVSVDVIVSVGITLAVSFVVVVGAVLLKTANNSQCLLSFSYLQNNT